MKINGFTDAVAAEVATAFIGIIETCQKDRLFSHFLMFDLLSLVVMFAVFRHEAKIKNGNTYANPLGGADNAYNYRHNYLVRYATRLRP